MRSRHIIQRMNQLADSRPVLIAGGGIGGMALALTLNQIGVPCQVFEAVPDLQPLGVGINLQPNAVRELYDLGLDQQALDTIGIQAREWALVGRNGHDVYAEPRGLLGKLVAELEVNVKGRRALDRVYRRIDAAVLGKLGDANSKRRARARERLPGA